MTPYEEPQSRLAERPSEHTAGIQWITIILALVIFFLVLRGIDFVPFNPSFDLDATLQFSLATTLEILALFVLVNLPWLAASIFLAIRVQHQRLLHGLIFCALLTLAYSVLIVGIRMYGGEAISLWRTFVDLLYILTFSLAITLLSMVVVKTLIDVVRKARKGARRIRIEDSAKTPLQ